MKIILAISIMVLFVNAGCATYWQDRQEELINQGKSLQEAIDQVATEQAKVAETITGVTGAVIDAAPAPEPLKQPIKEVVEWIVYAGLSLAGLGVTYKKMKNAPEGQLLG
jgi:type II secretory pathway pseudopilin PulG